MLYEALAQPLIFLCMSAAGFCCGFLFDIKTILSYFLKNNKIWQQVLLFFACFALFFVFFAVNLKINYGQFRFFTVLAFSLSFSIQRFFISSFVANPIKKCYNKMKVNRLERKAKRKANETGNEKI